jgi:hypothetical protein
VLRETDGMPSTPQFVLTPVTTAFLRYGLSHVVVSLCYATLCRLYLYWFLNAWLLDLDCLFDPAGYSPLFTTHFPAVLLPELLLYFY